MPVLDGFAASRKIRQFQREQAVARPTPIVALTANAIRGDRQLCLDAGMDEYLSKPFEAQGLVQLIDRVLDEAHASRTTSIGDKQRHATEPNRPGTMNRDFTLEAIAATATPVESDKDGLDVAALAQRPLISPR